MTEQELLLKALEIKNRLPVGTFWTIEYQAPITTIGPSLRLRLQAPTQQQARECRQAIGARQWSKNRSDCGWWQYTTESEGVSINIYAVTEAPPSCRMIEEEYTITEKVPIAFEEREVVKTRKRWECAPEEAAV